MYSSWSDFREEPQLNQAHYMILYRFFCEKAELNNRLIQFRYLDIGEENLENLKNDIPVMFQFKSDDIWWAAKLFSPACKPTHSNPSPVHHS